MSEDIQEIARDQWSSFCTQFTKEHAGKSVRVEVFGPGTNPHNETQSSTFVGITFEPKSDDIEISLGMEAADHVSHTVTSPAHLWVRPGSPGDIIDLKSADGITYLLHLSL